MRNAEAEILLLRRGGCVDQHAILPSSSAIHHDIPALANMMSPSRNSTSPPSDGKHALVFGASGISGWAIVNQLLAGYPSKTAFHRITALTNRPLPPEIAQWPSDSRLNVVSGIDLLDGSQDTLEKVMKEKIRGIESTTQVFFFSYKMDLDPDEESKINLAMLERSVKAVEKLSPRLEYVVLPTGTKASDYNIICGSSWILLMVATR